METINGEFNTSVSHTYGKDYDEKNMDLTENSPLFNSTSISPGN